MINIATLFSGVGAIEEALVKQNIDYKIVEKDEFYIVEKKRFSPAKFRILKESRGENFLQKSNNDCILWEKTVFSCKIQDFEKKQG